MMTAISLVDIHRKLLGPAITATFKYIIQPYSICAFLSDISLNDLKLHSCPHEWQHFPESSLIPMVNGPLSPGCQME